MKKLFYSLSLIFIIAGLATQCFADSASLTQYTTYPDYLTGFASLSPQGGGDEVQVVTDDSESTYLSGICDPSPCHASFSIGTVGTNDKSGVISFVRITARAKYTTTSGSVYLGWKSGVTEYGVHELSVTSTSYADYYYDFYTDPRNSDAAWTWDTVSNAVIVVKGTSTETKICAVKVEIIKLYDQINPWTTVGYQTWEEAINAFTDTLKADFSLYFMPGRFVETTAPNTYTADFNGFTFRVAPSDRYDYPVSSITGTGVDIELKYGSATDPFFHASLAGSGTVIFEGLSIDSSFASTGHDIFKSGTGAAHRLVVRNCVLRGADIASGAGIRIASASGAYLTAMNNFIYDFNDGIVISIVAAETDNQYILHNTIVSNVDDGIDAGANSNVFLFNNLSYGNGGDDYTGIGSATGYGNLCEDRTCHSVSFTNEGSENTCENTDCTSGSPPTPWACCTGSAAGTCDMLVNGDCTTSCNSNTQDLSIGGDASHNNSCTGHCDYIDNYYAAPASCLGTMSTTYVDDCFELASLSETSGYHIAKVKVGWQYEANMVSGKKYYIQTSLKDGTNTSSATANEYINQTAWTWYWDADEYATNPAGQPWTWSDIANLKLCISMKQDSGGVYGVYIGFVYVQAILVNANGNQINKTITWADSNAATSKEFFLPSGETDAIDKGVEVINTASFLGDKARYQFEDTDETADSSGNAKTLSANGTPASRFDAAEGHAAIRFDGTGDNYYLSDSGTVAGFPARGNDGAPTKSLTVSFWIKPEVTNAEDVYIAKWDDTTYSTTYKKESWKIYLNTSGQIVFAKAYYSGGAMGTETFTHPWAIGAWNWYHVSVSYDDTNKDVRIRIYDKNGNYNYPDFYDTTHTSYSMHVPSSTYAPNFSLGSQYTSGAVANEATGWLDDVVIFNKELTVQQMDIVRTVSSDALLRARGSISGIDDSGVGSAPDIGAYEYITPRDYYIGYTAGGDYSDGKSDNNKWKTFWNLMNRTLSAGDNVYLKKGNTWSGEYAAVLYMRAVGSKQSASTNVDLTWLAGDAGSTKPQINGYSTYNNANIIGYNLAISNVQFNFGQRKGLYLHGSSDCSLYLTDFYVNALASAQSVSEGWDGYVGEGCYIFGGQRMTIYGCIFSWNWGSGLATVGVQGSKTENTIGASQFNNNGRNGPYQYAFGYLMSGYGLGTVLGHPEAWTISNCTFDKNGYIGLGISGTGSLITDCTAHYNGDGFGEQGTFVFDGAMTGTNFAHDQWVKGRTSGVISQVHRCKDADYDSNRLSVYLPTRLCTAAGVPMSCCTGWNQGCTTDFTATEYIDECTDNTGACASTTEGHNFKASAMLDWTDSGDWSGGGMDARYATDVVVKDSEAGWNIKVHRLADAYGFDADDYSNNVIFHHCVAEQNEGSGFEFHNSGVTTACAAYNCLAYDNTNGDDLSNSAGFYISCVGDGAEGNYKTILKNNVSVLDNVYALKMRSSCKESLMTLENNCYWMGDADTDVIDWEGTAYSANDVQGGVFYYAEGKEQYGIGQDPLIVGLNEGVGDRWKYYAGSPLVDAGVDASGSSAINCTAGVGGTCKDYFGNDIPFDGDGSGVSQWDVGVWERQNTGGIIPKVINFFRRRIGKIEPPINIPKKAYAAEGESQ